MTRSIECARFRERLDDFVAGTAAGDELEALRAHAAACADCAMQLEVRAHIAGLSQIDLEAAVPEELVESVWPLVRARIGVRGRRWTTGRSWGWPARGLAAACLALLVGSGWLLVELASLREREEALTQQVERQQGWLAQLAGSSGPGYRTMALSGGMTWRRFLSRGGPMRVGELEELLASLPGNMTLLGAGQAEALIRRMPVGPALVVDSWLSEARRADGLQAEELLEVLRSLNLDETREIEPDRLLRLGMPGEGSAGL